MNDNQILIEVAKLDGWTKCACGDEHCGAWFPPGGGDAELGVSSLYLTSRDAIIPLLVKLGQKEKVLFLNDLRELVGENKPRNKAGTPIVSDFDLIVATPRQLCIALLKATGKFRVDG